MAIVTEDIAAVARAVKDKALLKVIVRTVLFDDLEITKACEIVRDAGTSIKTCTGFSKGGATTHQIQLMKGVLGFHGN